MLEYDGSIDRVFRALADPNRRAIVERLSRGPTSVSELARPLAITLAAVVQHLQILERAEVVRTEKVGRVRSCRIEPGGLKLVEDWCGDRRSLWQRRLDRLGEIVDEQPPKQGDKSDE
jgi:DNA-binding transcriptional ArsR family regulator